MLRDVHGAAAGTRPPAKRKVTLRRRERKEIIRLRLLRAGSLPRSVLSCDFARLCVEFAQLTCDYFFLTLCRVNTAEAALCLARRERIP